MQLAEPFYKLPLTFDADRLAAEVNQFTESEWRPHPQGHAGNWALPYVARGGNPDDDGVAGPMRPTPFLARCPYVAQVMHALASPIGRSRLMRLDGQAEATLHVDTNYYWQQRVRVHVPVVTFPEVEFQCGDASTRMAAGECWVFDTWRLHNVLNRTPKRRIHLVIDTVGSAAFWDHVHGRVPPRHVAFDPAARVDLPLESENVPPVMSPWEVRDLWAHWVADAKGAPHDSAALAALEAEFDALWLDWRATWARFGPRSDGLRDYAALRERFGALGKRHAGRMTLPNSADLGTLLYQSLAAAMVRADAAAALAAAPGGSVAPRAASARADVPDLGQARAAPRVVTRIERPLIIVGAPRSGSTLLFETLAQFPGLLSVGGESHRQFESIPALQPGPRTRDSNRLDANDATPDVVRALVGNFLAELRDRDGRPPAADSVRLLEKTPKNALRIPFLAKVFPDAQFVYLYRRPEQNVSSMIEGWESGNFVMYRQLPGWVGPLWSFLLVPGWRDLIGKPLAEIAATQWQRTQSQLLDDLAALPSDRVHALDYASFVADPARHVAEIGAFAGLAWDRPPPSTLPLSRYTMSAPNPDKWRRHEAVLAPYRAAMDALGARAEAFVAAQRARSPHVRQSANPVTTGT
ncbi:MAG: sulfotransferase [Proteobacteria bacterium]|nr:sulfotransferase [Pseudomonadota bacterium]